MPGRRAGAHASAHAASCCCCCRRVPLLPHQALSSVVCIAGGATGVQFCGRHGGLRPLPGVLLSGVLLPSLDAGTVLAWGRLRGTGGTVRGEV